MSFNFNSSNLNAAMFVMDLDSINFIVHALICTNKILFAIIIIIIMFA